MTRTQRLWPAIVGWLCLISSASVMAQDKPAERKAQAEKFFRAGEQAYKSGQYLVAAQAFEEAMRLLPLPAIAFSTAQAYRLQYFVDKDVRRLKRSVALYRKYIADVAKGGRRDDAVTSLAELELILSRVAPQSSAATAIATHIAPATQLIINSQTPAARASIDGQPAASLPLVRDVAPGKHRIRISAKGYVSVEQTHVAVKGRMLPVEITLAPLPATLRIAAGAGADVRISGRSYGTTPISKPIELPAGRHVVVVRRRGHRGYSQKLHLSRGQTTSLEIDLQKTRQRLLSYWILGAGAASLVVSGVAGLAAFSAQGQADDINQRRLAMGVTDPERLEYNRWVERRDSRRQTAFWALGLGLGLGLAGTLAYALDYPQYPDSARDLAQQRAGRGPRRDRPWAALGFSGRGLSVAMSGRF